MDSQWSEQADIWVWIKLYMFAALSSNTLSIIIKQMIIMLILLGNWTLQYQEQREREAVR